MIELLVVIVIVGILAAVTMAIMSDARKKGGDAGAKSNLMSARSQAEVFFNTNTVAPLSYTNVCTNAGAIGGAQTIGPQILAAARAVGLSGYSQDAAQNGVAPFLAICNDGTGLGWAVEIPLKNGTNQFWCLDSTGKFKQYTGSSISAAADVTCN